MSNYEQKDNTGSLFKNEKKETEKHPDYTGKAMIHGQQYYMSAWINKSKDGKTYMSFKFNVPEKNKAKPRDQYQPQDDADSIPF